MEKQPAESMKAAAEYSSDPVFGSIDMTAYRAFMAGAEWQKEKTAWVYLKEAKDAVIALEKEKGEPLNPRVAFVNGARWQKQQMLEGAVECVVENWNPEPHPEITIPLNPEVFGVGDKVKVIIVRENG